ncbi:transglutaminase domain-containing protein [Streptomyces sp. NPDC021093]|uniref:transglutaminase domain-containing protein n=1 Tax=Streptomyces sp. NPDC021093 TaxID=3365112 RepID=UPI00379AEAF4
MAATRAAGTLTGTGFRPVPGDLASYDTDLEDAAVHLGIAADRLAPLAASDLPHVRDPGRGTLFDYTDLTNAAYFSGSGTSVPELAWRFLLRFGQSAPSTWYRPQTWDVTVQPPQTSRRVARELGPLCLAVPDSGADGVELLDVLETPGGTDASAPGGTDAATPSLAGAATPGHAGAATPGHAGAVTPGLADRGYQDSGYRVVVRLSGTEDQARDPRVRSAYDRVLDALGSGAVAYQAVAEALRADPERAWELGMADCVVASRLIAAQLRAAGLTARTRRGYILGLVGGDHTWCEVEEDGRWKVLDPVFAHLIGRTGADDSFREACRGGRFNRLLPCAVDDAAPLIIRADGEPVPLWALAGVSARPWKERM